MKKRIIAASLLVPVLAIGIMWLAPMQEAAKKVTITQPVTAPVTEKKQPSKQKATTPRTTPASVLGFYTAYSAADKKAYHSLQTFGSSMSEVATMTFSYQANGGIAGTAPADGIALAQSEHIKPFAAIANKTSDGAFSKAIGHQLLTDPATRQAAIYNTANLVKQDGYQGVNLDFENLPAEDRAAFSKFVNDLAAVLHQNGNQLIVSVMAKTSDQPHSQWVGAFDYAALGRAADQVQLMTYDEHGPWDQPGSVASLPWVDRVLQYATTQIAPNKLLLGLAAYGYDWDLGNTKKNKAVAWKNINNLLASTQSTAKWDDATESPYFQYTAADGSQHVVWYENGTSIADKAKLVNRYKLAGVAMWHVGLEDQGFWQAVQSGLKE